MEDEDLYANLPHFDHKENLEKLQDSNKDLQEQVSHLKEIVEKLTQENATLKSNCTHLGKNISSLIKTARTEIKRKDARIAELNKENSLFKTRLRLPRNRLHELKQARQHQQRSETVREDRNRKKHDTSTSGERGGSQEGRQNRRSEESPQRKRFCASGERGNSNRSDGGPIGGTAGNSIEERSVEIPLPYKSSKEQKTNSNSLNICSQSANQNPDPPQIKKVPRVPNIHLPTLYSKRMFNQIYNIEPTKVKSNNLNENNIEKSITSKDQKVVENPNISNKDVSDKLKPTCITTTASSATLQPENTNMTVSSIMASLCVKTMEENNKLNLSGSDEKISSTIPIGNCLSNKIISDSTNLTDKTKDKSIEDPQSVEVIACSERPVTSQEKDELGTSLKIVADAMQKVKLIDQKKEFISLEEELHLSSDSRIDSTSANIVDIQVNIQSNVSDIPVAELKTIISNLNKFTDSTKVEESHSSINDNPKLNQTSENIIQPVNESTSKINSTTSPSNEIDCKNTEKFCSTTLGLRLLNRQTKTIVKPVSAQCCETYKKIVANEDLLRNKTESFPLVPKSPPHTEDKENEKHDLVEALFGSPLKWTENSVDDVMPKLCPPPSAFEDSCSAQIENTKFKKLNNTESVSSTKTVKEIIVSKNENDMSTMTTIESRISVQKIKEIPRRPFEQINNEKNEKSNFSSYLENTTEACDVPSFTLTTLSGSVKSMRKSPIASKYHDSILGQFDDTTQLISALAKEHSKVSPINTPIKENKTETPEKKLTANVFKTNQHQKVATPLNNCFTKKTILSSSIIKAPEKKIIFLDKPINILCPRRKTKASPKVTLKTQPMDKNKNKEEIKDNNTVSDQKISSQQNNKSSSCPSELNNKELIENNKEIHGRVPLEKNNLKILSLSEKHNTTNSKRNDNFKDAKRLPLSNKHDGPNSGRPRDDYKGYNSRRVPSTEKCDDSDSKRHLLQENNRDDHTKQLSSEKYIGSDSKKQFIDEEHRINKTKRPSLEKYHDRDSKRPPSPEKYDVTKRRFSHEKYKENSSKRMSSSEKYDDSSRRRRSNEKYSDSNSRRPSSSEKYDDSSRRRRSNEKYLDSNSRRPSSSEKYDDSSRRRRSNEKYLDSNSRRPSSSEKYDCDSSKRLKDNESSSSRRHESYKQYYDERGRKKVPFTTISSKTTVFLKSPSPRRERSPFKDSRSDKSHLSTTATFKRPLSYERIRRSNCLFRETSVERRVLKDARHRIRTTPIRIIKRKDSVAYLDRMDISHNSKGTISTLKRRDDTQSETIASPKEDHSSKPTHIVRSSNKIDWSATTTQVVSTQPVNISPKPKPESLMKWVLQPIDFGPLVSQSPREIIWKNLEITAPPSASRQNISPSKAGGQEITPQKSSPIVIISRRRPIKFGVCENNAQICQTAKES